MNKIKMVRSEGGSRVMSVTDIVPKDWVAVEAKITKQSKSSVTVIISKVK